VIRQQRARHSASRHSLDLRSRNNVSSNTSNRVCIGWRAPATNPHTCVASQELHFFQASPLSHPEPATAQAGSRESCFRRLCVPQLCTRLLPDGLHSILAPGCDLPCADRQDSPRASGNSTRQHPWVYKGVGTARASHNRTVGAVAFVISRWRRSSLQSLRLERTSPNLCWPE
jgi:hypothetical protein